jgi:Domain of unknown function (DUF2610)
MVKKFTANCDFGGQKAPVTLYIGTPAANSPHPLNFQSKWLAQTRGGNIPADIIDSFSKLSDIAVKNRVSFEDLCEYVIEELKSSNSLASDAKQATALAKPESKQNEK